MISITKIKTERKERRSSSALSRAQLFCLITLHRKEFPTSLTVNPKALQESSLNLDLLCDGWIYIYIFSFLKSGSITVWKQMLVELMEQGVSLFKYVSSVWCTVCLGPPRLWTYCLLIPASRRLPTRIFLHVYNRHETGHRVGVVRLIVGRQRSSWNSRNLPARMFAWAWYTCW